jgi:hypothetical protein
MKKLLTYIAFAFFLLNSVVCSNQQNISSTNSIEDSLKLALGITDSIRILRVDTVQASIAFIDYNKNSIFHEKLLHIRGTNINSDFYNNEYQKQLKSGHFDRPSIPKEIVKKWYRIYKYENGFYVYLDCDFQMVYETSDSAFISYPMDGASPKIIIGFEKQDNINRLITYNNDTIEIVKIYESPIYKLKFKQECNFYTPSDQINKFNIIVHHCSDLTLDIINFESNDCK